MDVRCLVSCLRYLVYGVWVIVFGVWCQVSGLRCLFPGDGDIYFVRPAMVSSINILLLGLAIFDILLILTSLLMVAIPSIHSQHKVVLEMRDR